MARSGLTLRNTSLLGGKKCWGIQGVFKGKDDSGTRGGGSSGGGGEGGIQ